MELLIWLLLILLLLVIGLFLSGERERPPIVVQVRPERLSGDNLPLIVLLALWVLMMTGVVGLTIRS